MNKSLSTIKKFQFFDLEKSAKCDSKLSSVGYKLLNMVPIEMKVYNKYYYIIGQLKLDQKNEFNRFRLVKIHPDGTIMDEYIPFSDTIMSFNILDLDGKTYLIALGTDLTNPEKEDQFEAKVEIKQGNQLTKEQNFEKITPSKNSFPSIKIYDFSNFSEKTNAELYQWQDPIVDVSKEEEVKQRIKFLEEKLIPLTTIKLMKKKANENELYQGNGPLDDNYIPITNITLFSISQNLKSVAFSLGKDFLFEIKTEDIYNLFTAKDKKFSLIKTMDQNNITNIKYMQFGKESFLFFSTNENTYYKNVKDPNIYSIGDKGVCGAEENNFDVTPRNTILLSNPKLNCIEEYDYSPMDSQYSKNRTKVFEKPTKYLQVFKTYNVFVLYEENICTLCVYDPNNNIFTLYNNGLNNILQVVTDKDKLYVLCENVGQVKIMYRKR